MDVTIQYSGIEFGNLLTVVAGDGDVSGGCKNSGGGGVGGGSVDGATIVVRCLGWKGKEERERYIQKIGSHFVSYDSEFDSTPPIMPSRYGFQKSFISLSYHSYSVKIWH